MVKEDFFIPGEVYHVIYAGNAIVGKLVRKEEYYLVLEEAFSVILKPNNNELLFNPLGEVYVTDSISLVIKLHAKHSLYLGYKQVTSDIIIPNFNLGRIGNV